MNLYSQTVEGFEGFQPCRINRRGKLGFGAVGRGVTVVDEPVVFRRVQACKVCAPFPMSVYVAALVETVESVVT